MGSRNKSGKPDKMPEGGGGRGEERRVGELPAWDGLTSCPGGTWVVILLVASSEKTRINHNHNNFLKCDWCIS